MDHKVFVHYWYVDIFLFDSANWSMSPRNVFDRLWQGRVSGNCVRTVFTTTIQVYTCWRYFSIENDKENAVSKILLKFTSVMAVINLSLCVFSCVEDYSALEVIMKISRTLLNRFLLYCNKNTNNAAIISMENNNIHYNTFLL